MRFARTLLLTIAMMLVASLAPAATASDDYVYTNLFAVDDGNGDYADVTLLCYGFVKPGVLKVATATYISCDMWDSGSISIHHEGMVNPPGGVATCYYKSNQMRLPVAYCSTIDVLFDDGTHHTDKQCANTGVDPPSHPTPTTPRTLGECVSPTPIPPPLPV